MPFDLKAFRKFPKTQYAFKPLSDHGICNSQCTHFAVPFIVDFKALARQMLEPNCSHTLYKAPTHYTKRPPQEGRLIHILQSSHTLYKTTTPEGGYYTLYKAPTHYTKRLPQEGRLLHITQSSHTLYKTTNPRGRLIHII